MTKAQCGRYANKVCPPLSQQQHTTREQLYASEELPVPGLTATEVGQPEENKLSAVTAPPDVPKIDGHRTVDLADVKSLYVATRLIDQGRNEEASDVLKLLLYDDEHLSSIIGGNHTGSSQNVFTVAYALRLLATIAFNREDYVEMETSLELACPLMAYVISTGVSKVGNSTDVQLHCVECFKAMLALYQFSHQYVKALRIESWFKRELTLLNGFQCYTPETASALRQDPAAYCYHDDHPCAKDHDHFLDDMEEAIISFAKMSQSQRKAFVQDSRLHRHIEEDYWGPSRKYGHYLVSLMRNCLDLNSVGCVNSTADAIEHMAGKFLTDYR